ncbi:taste receptor, type 2, member 200, tandem duplicate 2 [Danio rerio]|uniref:Taste receptor type 2 n=1 Tax=Danio rerio TaxID=7955 RepID=Q58WW7_DANRE|nr:taste receptor, type 2, member 200, tandem duplicate 2 [Danio rerio]AAI63240.1 Taste receptor, type 2, member 200.2 [Danio rerio]AAI63241.1 Taste receptor, type 2, member 200.2 [Danio rerio]AAX10118.1 taste receptor type T2R2 [Danio rerio]BAE80436.1 bitter taste receptor [Danio rerio]|eukprot:NP_001018341.1 taste receptor, type 2, member 200, tandem duplicate 2 [Danio rerio]
MSTDVGDVLFFLGVGVVGVSGNIFNLIFTVQQQVKTRTIQTVGLILDVISISNIILALAILSMVVGIFLNPQIWCIKPYPFDLRLEIYLMLTCGFISFWAIAWLSLFYCIKVVNFSSEIFRTLKKNISTVINTAVLLSCLFSCLFFIPLFSLDTVDSTEQNDNAYGNVTCPMPSFTIQMNQDAYSAAVLFLLCPIPLMIMLPTSVRMVVHLCAHTRALQKNQTQVQGSDSYLLVCKLTISLVGVYLFNLFFVSLFILMKLIGAYITYQYLVSTFTFYCGVTSALLTASNRYLKDKLWSLFCCRKAKEPASKSHTVVTGDV